MKNKFFKVFILYSSIALSLLTSCDNSESLDGRHPIFIKADSLYNDGRVQESYQYYEKYLQINPKSAKASYKLALISQDNGDYVKAIYFYEKYLELDPNSSDKEIIEKWIDASKKSLVKEISKDMDIPSFKKPDTSSLDTQVATLKEENELLQKKLQSLHETKNAIPDTVISNLDIKSEPVQKIYVVQEGDSLYKISQKVYGSNKYFKLIIEANKDKLKGTTAINLGDKLIIPPLKKNE